MALQKAERKSTFATSKKFLVKGDSLKGYFQGVFHKEINGKPVDVHTYLTQEGLFEVLGQRDILSQLEQNNVATGTYVEITFSGNMKKLKSGNTMKIYEVLFDRDQVSTASTIDEALESGDFEESEEAVVEEPLPARPTAPAVAAKVPSAEARTSMSARLAAVKASR